MNPDPVKDLPEPLAAPYRRGPHWIALFAAVFTLPLLYVGGTVTTYRVGLAVPDWPQTFGINMFLYDFWNAPFGVRIEHTHRLYGAAVGLATLLLSASFLIFERRPYVKWLGIVAVAAVIVQGVLGGTRVTQVSTLLAAVHGVVGQAFFGLMVVLCVLTSKRWRDRPAPVIDTQHLRARALTLLGVLGAQIAMGSWLRHYGARGALVVHVTLALYFWVHALLFVGRVRRSKPTLAMVVPSSVAVACLSSLQIVLGIAATVFLLPFDGTPRPVSFYQAVVRTGHQTNGALLLAATIVMTLRACRQLAGSTSARAPRLDGGTTRPVEPVALDWEAVA